MQRRLLLRHRFEGLSEPILQILAIRFGGLQCLGYELK